MGVCLSVTIKSSKNNNSGFLGLIGNRGEKMKEKAENKGTETLKLASVGAGTVVGSGTGVSYPYFCTQKIWFHGFLLLLGLSEICSMYFANAY